MDIKDLVEKYADKRAERQALARKVKELEVEEKELESQLLAYLLEHKLPFVSGAKFIANCTPYTKYAVQDWPLIYDYIRQNNAFDLLHKRLTETAVKLREEDGIVVPGVVKFPEYKVTLSEIK